MGGGVADGYARSAFDLGCAGAGRTEDEAAKPVEQADAKDRPVASYGAPPDRWPALSEASSADYFDDVMAAWRELNRRQRLAREQTGGLWSE